jgi:hypothetical protein
VTDPATDRVAFARDVLGLDLFEHEAEALGRTELVVALPGGRRSGKTTTACAAGLHAVTTRRGIEWLVTAANADKVRQTIGEYAELLRTSRVGADVAVDEQAMRLDVRGSGSAIVGVPPTGGQLRGFGRRTFGVHIDEAGHCPPGVWRDVRYVLADHAAEGAQAWLTGSPWGASDHFFPTSCRLARDGDPDYWSPAVAWRTAQNPRIPADWIERERARLNSIEAAAELDGEWVEDGLQFFPRALLESCVADVELPALASLPPGPRPVVGCDWAVAYDHCAAAVLYRLPLRALNPAARPTFVVIPHVFAQGARLHRVVGELVAADRHARFAYVSTEVVGVGAGPSEELHRQLAGRIERRWNQVATTRPIKLAAYGLVRWLLERRQLVLPRDPVLLRQLAGLRLELDSRGSGSIDAEDAAVHDDVADALAFAALPYKRRGEVRVSCGLAVLADPERAVPDARPSAFEAETVKTGGGLRVWRTPPLQSIAGPEFWAPSVEPLPELDP